MAESCGQQHLKTLLPVRPAVELRASCVPGVQVPFKLRDEDIPDDWSCSQNIWDKDHNSCSVPQALTDEEIDEILALQVQQTSLL